MGKCTFRPVCKFNRFEYWQAYTSGAAAAAAESTREGQGAIAQATQGDVRDEDSSQIAAVGEPAGSGATGETDSKHKM